MCQLVEEGEEKRAEKEEEKEEKEEEEEEEREEGRGRGRRLRPHLEHTTLLGGDWTYAGSRGVWLYTP